MVIFRNCVVFAVLSITAKALLQVDKRIIYRYINKHECGFILEAIYLIPSSLCVYRNSQCCFSEALVVQGAEKQKHNRQKNIN